MRSKPRCPWSSTAIPTSWSSADLWQTHLEPKFRDRAIRIERREGVEHLIIGEESVLSGVLAGLGGAHLDRKHLFTPGMTYADGCEPASYEPVARTKMLDALATTIGVLFPTIGILLFPTEDVELARPTAAPTTAGATPPSAEGALGCVS